MADNNDPKEGNGKTQPVTNNPDEAMTTPKEVEESNDPNIDEDFPGYPHYPAKDDILDPDNNNGRLDLDVENLSRSNNLAPEHIQNVGSTPPLDSDFTQVPEDQGEGDIGIVSGTEADVTEEDLVLLGPRDGDMDMDEDEELRQRGWEPRTGKDLDVPDAATDEGEALGQEDEQNSYYSLGGDRMENLEENDDQNNF